jgi:hypothetical protein
LALRPAEIYRQKVERLTEALGRPENQAEAAEGSGEPHKVSTGLRRSDGPAMMGAWLGNHDELKVFDKQEARAMQATSTWSAREIRMRTLQAGACVPAYAVARRPEVADRASIFVHCAKLD